MRLLKRAAIAVSMLIAIVALSAYASLRGSLPKLDGDLTNNFVAAPVAIERDALGVVTITGASRADVAYATGYAHGQDRFFQMDLQRREAAGELAALLGPNLVAIDKRFRRHNFRQVARQVIVAATSEEKLLIDAYVAGVNAALAAMSVRPFEYLLLNSQPAPWLPEDCVLVAHAMYIDLNDSLGAHELERARVHASVARPLFDLLYPRASEWDAPLDVYGWSPTPAPLPGPDVIDLSKTAASLAPKSQSRTGGSDADYPGSNNWAIAGSRTKNGVAIVANDMHLSLRLPHIWYRARLIVKSANPKVARDLTGVTLPGLPLLIAGSNRHVAWGFTNSHGNFDDLVIVETDAAHPNQYRNVDRSLDYALRRERIDVHGNAPIEVEYRDTIWGPLLDDTFDGKPLALAWTAQQSDGTNLHHLDLEAAASVQEALDIANRSGIPVQNFVVADVQGHIGWTPIGKLPKRIGFDGTLPVCWGCAPNIGWEGWIAPNDYPRIIDPPQGQLWSANSRVLAERGYELIGDEDMDRGARTKQIRDDLAALKAVSPGDMLQVHLDDRALFLARWRDLLVRMQDEAYLKGHDARRLALKLVESWSGKASVADAGYRIVRAFRLSLQEDVYSDLIAPALAKYPEAKFKPSARFEDSLWRIVTAQPANLLDPKSERWDLKIMAALDRAIDQLKKECGVSDKKLGECTWGRRNELHMEHALASSLWPFGRWLRVPREALPGDNDMPRVQGVAFGASERFAVSPGHEDEGYFHMPGGQSGHPLSPYFKAGHEAWVKGEAMPFLPGEPQHRLQLAPAR